MCGFREWFDTATLQISQLDGLTDTESKDTVGQGDRFDIVEPRTAHVPVIGPQVRYETSPKFWIRLGHGDSLRDFGAPEYPSPQSSRIQDCTSTCN